MASFLPPVWEPGISDREVSPSLLSRADCCGSRLLSSFGDEDEEKHLVCILARGSWLPCKGPQGQPEGYEFVSSGDFGRLVHAAYLERSAQGVIDAG